MESAGHILVVDDDGSVRDAICDYLSQHGFSVRTASGAAELDARLAEAPADLLILDLMLPGEDGLAICRRLRPAGPAVLMLSALAGVADRVIGLELGADDYLAKPFEPRELLARVRAVLRRSEISGAAGPAYLFAGWRYDVDSRALTDPSGRPVELTRGEHTMLRALVERPGRIMDRDLLLTAARGGEPEAFDRAVDLAISRLRRKLGSSGWALIETVRGEGYRFRGKVRRL